MLLWTTLKIALASLAANKLRSILTMLGVIIGVGAVIAMLSLGDAFSKQIGEQLSSLGTNLLYVRPGERGMGAVTMSQTLTVGDCEAIAQVDGVRAVSPMVLKSARLKAGNKNSSSALILGADPALAAISNYVIVPPGRLFTDRDVRSRRRVCVIGPKTARDLFGGQNPLMRRIKVAGISFTVLGTYESKGDLGRYSPDDQVILPYTVAMEQLAPRQDHLQTIAVETHTPEDLDPAGEKIRQLLRRRHRLLPGEADDFDIQNMAEILATFDAIMLGLTAFLGVVAGISLIVGGIGIMNIMLATVAERTREIGVRKALGAKNRDILRQFLIEALVLTLGGGLIGLLLGWGLMALTAVALHSVFELSPVLQWHVVGISIAVATIIGLISGLYPAWRASRLDPVEALRYE